MEVHTLHSAFNRVIGFYCTDEDITLDKQLGIGLGDGGVMIASLWNLRDPLYNPKE